MVYLCILLHLFLQINESLNSSAKGVDIWQKITAIATAAYTIAFVGSLIFIVRQLRQITKAGNLEASNALFEETKNRGDIRKANELYRTFCEDGYELSQSSIEKLRPHLVELVRMLSRLGALLQDSALNASSVLRLHAYFFLRLWIILEGYIYSERENRRNPSVLAEVQYLAIECLYLHLVVYFINRLTYL